MTAAVQQEALQLLLTTIPGAVVLTLEKAGKRVFIEMTQAEAVTTANELYLAAGRSRELVMKAGGDTWGHR